MKIDSLESLRQWREKLPPVESKKLTLYACAGTSCLSSDSDLLIERLRERIKAEPLEAEVELVRTGCVRFCGLGPVLLLEPEGVAYGKVTLKDVDEIVDEHLKRGNIVERLLYEDPEAGLVKSTQEMGFYKKQKRIALKNCGRIDPWRIEHYIKQDGYEALGIALSEMTSQEVVEIIKQSGLRGRGGGGFPTGRKWEFTLQESSDEKYIICNADEGDPGAFMDRSIIEGDPHTLIEAMAIGAYATGANQGYIYIRAEYATSIEPLRAALDDAREHGFLGKDLFGSGFDFDIEIKLGAGAFVCGEETALIHSMEGQRGEPTTKPPFPSQRGFRGKPSTVNNVETFANIPQILLNGPEWFASVGTEGSKGTKVFALAGNVKNIGLVEVPMGITFNEIVYEIGGGPSGKEPVKAVQIGGPSGGVITKEHFDTPIDYDSLDAIGAMMGSGGLIVMDETSDMVEIAKFYLDFPQDESCGKCTPCRVGTKRMYEILDRLTEMEGVPEDLQRLRMLGENIQLASLCGLGQSAPNPVLSTLDAFPDEYMAYAYRTKRTAYAIDADLCIGCTKCKRVCPVDCIEGEVRETHIIDEAACTACGACYSVCPKDAIIRP